MYVYETHFQMKIKFNYKLKMQQKIGVSVIRTLYCNEETLLLYIEPSDDRFTVCRFFYLFISLNMGTFLWENNITINMKNHRIRFRFSAIFEN